MDFLKLVLNRLYTTHKLTPSFVSLMMAEQGRNMSLNRLAPELFFLILAHSVYKMRIKQEPNKLEL